MKRERILPIRSLKLHLVLLRLSVITEPNLKKEARHYIDESMILYAYLLRKAQAPCLATKVTGRPTEEAVAAAGGLK